MNEQLLQIGVLEVLIMGKDLPIRNLPYSKQKLIAIELINRLNQNLSTKYPDTISFEITAINSGCIKVKLKTTWLLIGALTAGIVAYPDFKAGAKELWNDGNRVIEFVADGRMCSARFAGEQFIEGLYGPIKKGITLSEVVSSLDCGKNSPEQIMVAIYNANHNLFINENINFIREGCVLVIPNQIEISKTTKNEAVKLIQHHNNIFNVTVQTPTRRHVLVAADEHLAKH